MDLYFLFLFVRPFFFLLNYQIDDDHINWFFLFTYNLIYDSWFHLTYYYFLINIRETLIKVPLSLYVKLAQFMWQFTYWRAVQKIMDCPLVKESTITFNLYEIHLYFNVIWSALVASEFCIIWNVKEEGGKGMCH